MNFNPNFKTADSLFVAEFNHKNLNLSIQTAKACYVAKNKIVSKIKVFNTKTKILSEKAIYLSSKGLYFIGKDGGFYGTTKRYYLEKLIPL